MTKLNTQAFVGGFLDFERNTTFTLLAGVVNTMELAIDLANRLGMVPTMSMIFMLIVAGLLACGAEEVTSILITAGVGTFYGPFLVPILGIPVAVVLDNAGSILADVLVSAGLATLPSPPPPPPPPQPSPSPSHGDRRGDRGTTTKPRQQRTGTRTGNRSGWKAAGRTRRAASKR